MGTKGEGAAPLTIHLVFLFIGPWNVQRQVVGVRRILGWCMYL